MDIYQTIENVLVAAGIETYQVYPNVVTGGTYVYFQRVSTDKLGNFGLRNDRFRFTCVAQDSSDLKTLIASVENALYFNQIDFDLVFPVFQMEGSEGKHLYSKMDMYIEYKET